MTMSYENFTDRARKVMHNANMEAQRFNHEYIGTEHMLLGLIKMDSGTAITVLKNLQIDLRRIRLDVEKIVDAGPDMVTMGKLPTTPLTKKIIEYAKEEAKAIGVNYVGTEALLLGMLRETEGVAAQVLMNLGLTLEKAREEVMKVIRSKAPLSTASVQISRLGTNAYTVEFPERPDDATRALLQYMQKLLPLPPEMVVESIVVIGRDRNP